ncbi:hypothetical protein PV327_001088 [Microctonus hyperodae]|uniref:E2F/DP family winged-helix DNA-binding domain-containing protein n=1 Tax=Microctonus hyperodae TaxID=165561 RepID=A0AA39L2U3_MICHY|nr:hypothetical protein PV327_001088 [Microctonus hyperodae]
MSDIGDCTPERRKILGELSNMKSEPISPTANLRLLTSLASNLKSATDHGNCQNNIQVDDTLAIPSSSMGLKLLPRKQKSLGLLCNKFLNLYPLEMDNNVPQEISLDGTAKILGTEKRRIYDIINVLESLEMASKAGKNRYLWHGQNGLTATLIRLKSLAIRLGLREQIQEIQRVNKAYTGDYHDSSSCSNEFIMSFEESIDDETNNDSTIKEDKSLGAMCQKFIMLFLVSMKNGVINLDIAAKVLIIDMDNSAGEIIDNASRSRFKTKVRRLYDIANVLTAIGLIKKVDMNDRIMKKPVFKYIGPHVDTVDLDTDTPTRETHNSLIGMSTPNKRAHTFPRAFRVSNVIDTEHKILTYASTSTPITDKRKLRKRKLFDTDSLLTRTQSSPALEGKSHSLERLDDSILRVAEMELQRLNSSEECKPKACTKLFTRYNSDSCIVNTNHGSKDGENNESGGTILNFNSRKQTPISKIPLIIINNNNNNSNNNNINGNQIGKQSINCQNTSLIASQQSATINTIITSTNENATLQPVKKKIIKLLPIGNVSALNVLHPNKIITKNLITNDTSHVAKIARYKVEPKIKPPKIINLANFDPKKLIPIKRSDLKLLTPGNRVAMTKVNSSNTSYAMLTRIQAPVVSPGDTFKAIKVGNTLQLVPIKDHSAENSNNETKQQTENAS